MKNIFSLAFCLLFAGGALLQSCSKPDAVTNTPDPANPTVPVDSIKPGVPGSPLTEAQIIQKAIAQLPGTYLMTGREWDMRDITLYGPGGGKATDTFGSHESYGNSNLLTQEFNIPFDSNIINHIAFVMKYDSNTYYNRIFVNAAGDSFIAAQCGSAPRFGDVIDFLRKYLHEEVCIVDSGNEGKTFTKMAVVSVPVLKHVKDFEFADYVFIINPAFRQCPITLFLPGGKLVLLCILFRHLTVGVQLSYSLVSRVGLLPYVRTGPNFTFFVQTKIMNRAGSKI